MFLERAELIIIRALEWAIECGQETTKDLIRGMRITSDELECIGYDKLNFKEMHGWAI